MAITTVALGIIRGKNGSGDTIPILDAGFASEDIVPTGTSAATTLAATADRSQVFEITTDTSVYVAFGTAPDASTTPRSIVPAGTTKWYGARPGYKCAVQTIA